MCFPTPDIPEIEAIKPPPEPPKPPQAPADSQTDSDIVKKAKGTKALKIDLSFYPNRLIKRQANDFLYS